VEEQILCFKSEILRAYPAKTFYDESLWRQILAHLEPKARSVAEHDYNTKQLVVYVLINHGETFLSYQRTPKTTETRLKALYSIGIGGHVNVDDQIQPTLFGAKEAAWKDFVLKAVRREVSEEVQIEGANAEEPRLICFVNDDSNDVGKVHFGVVFVLKLGKPSVAIRGERGIGKLSFRTLPELISMRDTLETWSQLLVDFLSREDSGWRE
jgi:predicted NUDIX family phosphoesterase